MIRMRSLVAVALLAFGMFVAGLACGPIPIEPSHVVTPAANIACVLLRAFGADGTLQEVCATAEELAPLVEEVISQRELVPPSDQKASAATVAFSFPAPPRRVPRRRCVQWQHVGAEDSGGPESASGNRGNATIVDGAAGRDAERDDGGERRDGGRERSDGGRTLPLDGSAPRPHGAAP